MSEPMTPKRLAEIEGRSQDDLRASGQWARMILDDRANLLAEVRRLQAENTDLRAVLAAAKYCRTCSHPIGYHHRPGDACSCRDCSCEQYLAPQSPEGERLEAECERLRAALREIADSPATEGPTARRLREIARAALGEE